MKSKQQSSQGFTLIELLVVIAIIALLSSVALIGFQEARKKSRDAKRLSDMTQMANAMELYFNTYKGYPSASGTPAAEMRPLLSTMPTAPMPPDGACDGLHPVVAGDPVPSGISVNTYYYVPSGTPYTISGRQLVPDYAYYFCLGQKTGNFDPGVHFVTSRGIR